MILTVYGSVLVCAMDEIFFVAKLARFLFVGCYKLGTKLFVNYSFSINVVQRLCLLILLHFPTILIMDLLMDLDLVLNFVLLFFA